MKKFILLFSFFLLLLQSVFAQDCPFDFRGFIAEVKAKCINQENIDYCTDLAYYCDDMEDSKGFPASYYFMNSINGDVLAAMFEEGLDLPFNQNAIMEKTNFYVDFFCDMIVNHSRGILPFENFKAIDNAFAFGEDILNYNICSFDDSLLIDFRPIELAAFLKDRQLTKYFRQFDLDMSDNNMFGIPLDIWFARYYPTKRSEEFFRALNNPANIVMINKDTDFSFLMPKGTQVLLVGEAHHSKFYKAVKQMISSLKLKPGLTHFASEFLLEMQEDDIADFRRTGNINDIKLKPKKKIARRGQKVLKEFNNVNSACLSSLGCDTDILALEKTHRVLGHDEEDNQEAQESFYGILDNYEKKYKDDEKLLKVVEFHNRMMGEDGIEGRNREWAEHIHKALSSSPSARLFAYMGKLHANGAMTGNGLYDGVPSLMDLLSDYGYKIKVLGIVGGKYGMFPDSYLFKNANLQDKYFIFIVPDSLKDIFGVDFILNVPTTGEQERTFEKFFSSYKADYY